MSLDEIRAKRLKEVRGFVRREIEYAAGKKREKKEKSFSSVVTNGLGS